MTKKSTLPVLSHWNFRVACYCIIAEYILTNTVWKVTSTKCELCLGLLTGISYFCRSRARKKQPTFFRHPDQCGARSKLGFLSDALEWSSYSIEMWLFEGHFINQTPQFSQLPTSWLLNELVVKASSQQLHRAQISAAVGWLESNTMTPSGSPFLQSSQQFHELPLPAGSLLAWNTSGGACILPKFTPL